MADLISRLKEWSSCDIADGLSKLGYKHGGFQEGLVMYSPAYQSGPTKIVGQAFTVKFAAKDDSSAPKLKGNYVLDTRTDNGLAVSHSQVDQIPEGAVVFISQPAPHINACYGGLMSLRAKYLKAEGVVIDGKLRDLQEHRDLEFPLFARGVGTTAGGAVCFPSEVNVPVKLQSSIQDSTITPGDYIIADQDGVVVLPAKDAEKVLEVIPAIAEADRKAGEAIRGGMSVQEAFAKFRGK